MTNPKHVESNKVRILEIVRLKDETLEPNTLRRLADKDWHIVGAYPISKPRAGTIYRAEKIFSIPDPIKASS